MISNSCCSISRTKFGADVRSVMAEICAPNFDFNLFPFQLLPLKDRRRL